MGLTKTQESQIKQKKLNIGFNFWYLVLNRKILIFTQVSLDILARLVGIVKAGNSSFDLEVWLRGEEKYTKGRREHFTSTQVT